MKTLIRLSIVLLMLIVFSAQSSYAGVEGRHREKIKTFNSKKRSKETSYYSRQAEQFKYKKCPKFRRR